MRIVKKINNYKRELKQHLEMKISDIIPKAALNYHSKGNRHRVKLRKRLIEDGIFL